MEWHKGDCVDTRRGASRATNRNGVPRRWTTTCTVTDAEPGRAFAFDVEVPRHPRRALALRHHSHRRAVAASPSRPGTTDPAGSCKPARYRHRRPWTATTANAEHIKLHAAAAEGQGRGALGPARDLVGDDGDRRRRPAAARLVPVGGLVGEVHAAHAQPAQRFGLPVARPVPDPRQLGAAGCACPSTRSASVRPARLVAVTPWPTYPPAHPSPLPCRRRRRPPSRAGTASTPHQAWAIGMSRICGSIACSTAVRCLMVRSGTRPSTSVREPKRYGTLRPPIAMRSSTVRWA